MTDYLLSEFNINRIETEIYRENIATIKLYEKLGFKREVLRKMHI